MGDAIADDPHDVSDLPRRAAAGHQESLRALPSRSRDRFHLRLSRRRAGRVDDPDVLPEAYLEIAGRLGEYHKEPTLPFFPWLRHMTALKLAEVDADPGF